MEFLKIVLNLQIKCFTFGFDKKGEYKYSRLLTKIFKIKHYFMKIDKEELIKNCSLKLNLSSGMYNHYICGRDYNPKCNVSIAEMVCNYQNIN